MGGFTMQGRTMKRLLAFVLACAMVSAGVFGLGQPVVFADDPPSGDASFEVDVDPSTAEIDTTRGVAVGTAFNIDVVVNTSGDLPWEAYQVTITFDDEVVSAVAPDVSWDIAPAEGVNGANRFAFTTGAFCTPSDQAASVFNNTFAMTCTEDTSVTNHTGEGPIVQFAFRCDEAGTAEFTISDIDDTFLFDADSNDFNDHTHGATVECGGTPAATNTPGAATATPAGPAPATATPGGPQPTAPAAATATPAGGAGGSIGAPNTGAGAQGTDSWVALAVALLAVAGAAMSGVGLATRRLR
jgi:hypothetical protein